MPNAARLAAALAALVLMVPGGALAQVLYKWIDADGKTQYSDRPPKEAKGPVTRIEPDATPDPAPAPATKAAAPLPAQPAKTAPQDVAGKRRAVRAALEKRLAAARDKLDTARRALAEVSGPEADERQVVQQQMKAGGQGGMHGLSAQRSNCRPVVDKNGKAGVMCPAVMPNEAYFERVAKLEEAVRQAEQEVADAEEAWRRGVD